MKAKVFTSSILEKSISNLGICRRCFLGFFTLLLCIWSLAACKETPPLENFDQQTWKQDQLGCQSLRKSLLENLKANESRLIGLGQNQIISLLGKPDLQQLYQRNQRFYVYFYQKGKQCEDKTKVNIQDAPLVKIRFSALDRVTELRIQ